MPSRKFIKNRLVRYANEKCDVCGRKLTPGTEAKVKLHCTNDDCKVSYVWIKFGRGGQRPQRIVIMDSGMSV